MKYETRDIIHETRYEILDMKYLKADASAAGPKRFPNHSIQWMGSVMFFKWFCWLFVCYICSFSFAILFVETFSERSFRDLFVLCLNS